MKKNKLIALMMIVFMLVVTGCNNDKKYEELMTEGKDLISSENYELALDRFAEALEEKEGDEEATNLYEQLKRIIQVEAKIKAKLYQDAIDLCEQIINDNLGNNLIINSANKLKKEATDLKTEADNLTFKEEISKKINEAKELVKAEEYMKAKAQINFVIEKIKDLPEHAEDLKECNSIVDECNKKLDEIAAKKEEEEKKKEENKQENTNQNQTNEDDDFDEFEVDFNDELKTQIAIAGEAYVEFYFEYASELPPSEFANQAYEDTENDTPLGEYKEEGRKIFIDAFQKAFEATGNEYY